MPGSTRLPFLPAVPDLEATLTPVNYLPGFGALKNSVQFKKKNSYLLLRSLVHIPLVERFGAGKTLEAFQRDLSFFRVMKQVQVEPQSLRAQEPGAPGHGLGGGGQVCR